MIKSFFIQAACFFILFISCAVVAQAQKKSYRVSLLTYRQNYVDTHEVVGKNDRKYLQFYTIDKSYCINTTFTKIEDRAGFDMNTSSGKKRKYFKYGMLTFRLHKSLLHLYVYQSEELMKKEALKEYLFVPFGDATSGFESYGGGRYIDLSIADIKNNRFILDFNKAYNPYCAYTIGYSCPIPPIENLLTVAITAGEKNYGNKIH